jgi:cellobiose-specific phosphotransferase system component IIB
MEMQEDLVEAVLQTQVERGQPVKVMLVAPVVAYMAEVVVEKVQWVVLLIRVMAV